jgi:diamine N-acetyltransferase
VAAGDGDIVLQAAGGRLRDACAALAVHEDQRRFVAPVAHYLALCDDGPWTPLAVCRGGAVVGFVMWAVDVEEGSHWIGGVVVDRAHQRRGVGRAAMRQLLALLTALRDCREIALSYDADNATARRLYGSLGFRETGERTDDGEVVARLALAVPAAVTGSRAP